MRLLISALIAATLFGSGAAYANPTPDRCKTLGLLLMKRHSEAIGSYDLLLSMTNATPEKSRELEVRKAEANVKHKAAQDIVNSFSDAQIVSDAELETIRSTMGQAAMEAELSACAALKPAATP